MKKLIISILCLFVISCGNEGFVEGVIQNTPYRVNVGNVKAIPSGGTSLYSSIYPVVVSGGLIVYICKTVGKEKDVCEGIVLVVNDVNTVIYEALQFVPGNVTCLFYYNLDGQMFSTEAIAGEVFFDEISPYQGDRVTGSGSCTFPEGELTFDFSTTIGL
jgi:hypothetical protein